MPEVSLPDFSKMTIKYPKVEIGEKDIDQAVKSIRERFVTWKDVKRASKKNDKINIDFEGFVDGDAFGGKAEAFDVEIGKGQVIPDFDKALTGLKVGDEAEKK